MEKRTSNDWRLHLATTTTATVMQSLGPNAHITPVNDYGVTFSYMRQAGKEDQGLESTFLDLKNVGDDEIILGAQAIRGNTKVNIFGYFMNVLSD